MRTLLVVWLGVLASALPAEARTWTDDTGRYHLNADLVGVTGGKVRLKTPEGHLYSIPFERLSPADQQNLLNREQATQTLTAETQPGSSGTGDRYSQPPGQMPGGGPASPKNPAPLPLDLPPLSGQTPANLGVPMPGTSPLPLPGENPAANETTNPSSTGQPPPPASSKDKRIFSGGRSTFHLDSRDGTGAYWLQGKHYLAKLTYLNTQGDYVYFTGSGEGGVQYWAFFDISACGPSRVYAWSTSGNRWRLYDWDYRELPN